METEDTTLPRIRGQLENFAKDTIEYYQKTCLCYPPSLERTARAIAEISFRAGIGEAVEFVISNKMVLPCDYRITGLIRQDEEHRSDCRKCAWQAKLREWGYEKH